MSTIIAETIVKKSPELIIKMSPPKKTVVYDTYWKFAGERQSIFFRRIKRELPPWTSDVILELFKFTNAYRVADRVSQFLIKEVIYKGDQTPKEILFRIILFKLFNKIETWRAIRENVSEVSYRTFEFAKYSQIFHNLKREGKSIYSGAYIMASGKSYYGYPLKHQNHLRLVETIISSNLADKLSAFKGLKQLYDELKGFPTIGPFLAYQYAIDINYSNLAQFSEMEFVKAGPGAKDGIRKCFSSLGDYTEEDIIKMMADNQEAEFGRLEINFQTLWGRHLQLIDCQNLFCEVDKYARVAHPNILGISNRVRIKQKFRPSSLEPIDYFFPPKWQLDKL